jgi:predicted acetyltransferase
MGGSEPGVATAVMTETLRRARDAGCIVSALMPFRASFYEHFGYGVIERRNEWTLPMSVLPSGPTDGLRYYEPADFATRADCLRRINRAGQCDIERSDDYWHVTEKEAATGFQFVDRPDAAGPVRGSLTITDQTSDRNRILRVQEIVFEDAAALRRQLHFLGAQRDQYSLVRLTLPADVPLNWLLKEVQLPHRPVHHATAEARPFTRMQLRILDHERFLEALHLPGESSGSATVEVHEPEGHVSRLGLQLSDGRIAVSSGGASGPSFAVTAARWAAIATGDMKASAALRLGLAEGDPQAANLLDELAHGPSPFCHEYF